LEKASAVAVFHNEAYNVIKTYFPCFKSKGYIVPQGVDIINHTNGHHVLRGKYGLNINDIIFLIVAGIRPVKNIGFALDAFIEIEKKVPDVKLLLAGPVIDNEEAQRVLISGERLSCFRYLGEKTNNEIRKLMHVSDVLINTSLHEGMPGAVLEAMAEKLPVLATLTSGNNVLVDDGKNGFLVPLGQKDKMIEAAIKLAIDKTLRQNMGNYGRQIVKSDYSVKQEIDLYTQIYDKVLTGQKDLKDSIDT
jgi:glycosyltransferase involved in cell wall biosynthesis